VSKVELYEKIRLAEIAAEVGTPVKVFVPQTRLPARPDRQRQRRDHRTRPR